MTSSSTHLVNAAFVYFSLNMFLNVLKYAINVKNPPFLVSQQPEESDLCPMRRGRPWDDHKNQLLDWCQTSCGQLALLFSASASALHLRVLVFTCLSDTEEEKKTFSLHHCIYSLTSCSAWFVDLRHSTTALHCLSFSFILTTDSLRVFQWIRYMAAF